jgi:predicted nuclease with TOPRIM domain
MITDMTHNSLLNEARKLQTEKQNEINLVKQMEDLDIQFEKQKESMRRMEQVVECAKLCQTKTKQWTPSDNHSNQHSLLESLTETFERLQNSFFEEYKENNLDALIMAIFAKEVVLNCTHQLHLPLCT